MLMSMPGRVGLPEKALREGDLGVETSELELKFKREEERRCPGFGNSLGASMEVAVASMASGLEDDRLGLGSCVWGGSSHLLP